MSAHGSSNCPFLFCQSRRAPSTTICEATRPPRFPPTPSLTTSKAVPSCSEVSHTAASCCSSRGPLDSACRNRGPSFCFGLFIVRFYRPVSSILLSLKLVHLL